MISVPVLMSLYFFILKKNVQPSLKIFQKTILDAVTEDPTFNDDDIEKVKKFSDSFFINPRMLIKYSNNLLLNQKTILDAAHSDRDFIEKNNRLREAIISLNHSILSDKSMENLLEEILEIAINTIDGSVAGTVIIPDSNGMVKYTAASGMDLEKLRRTKLKFQDIILLKMNNNKVLKPTIIRNKARLIDELMEPEDAEIYNTAGAFEYVSTLCAPIFIDNTIYGVLSVDSSDKTAFNSDDIRMMEYFTSEMALVIKNSRLISKAFHMSKYDSLTNVHNRHYFEDMAGIVTDEVQRYGGKLHFVLFDLDDFKVVNDSYGHESGDRVLKKFAEAIKSSIRGSDLFARYGGDEFIAYFRNSSSKDIENKIQAISDRFDKKPLLFKGQEYRIRFSYGIAEFPENGSSLEELLRQADDKMYECKRISKTGERE